LQALIAITEEEEDMEEDVQLLFSATTLPAYLLSWKGKTKVPKDLDEMKSLL